MSHKYCSVSLFGFSHFYFNTYFAYQHNFDHSSYTCKKHTHTCTHACTHARTHARTHTQTHTSSPPYTHKKTPPPSILPKSAYASLYLIKCPNNIVIAVTTAGIGGQMVKAFKLMDLIQGSWFPFWAQNSSVYPVMMGTWWNKNMHSVSALRCLHVFVGVLVRTRFWERALEKQIWGHFLVKVATLAYFHISSMLKPKMWVAKF